MTQLNFKILGINDVTNDLTYRFTCTTNDGDSLFVGTDSTINPANIWQYKDGNWKQITDNFHTAALNSKKGVNSLLFKNGRLYAGTSDGYSTTETGKVLRTCNKGWEDTGIANVYQNVNSTIRNLISVGNDIWAAGSYYEVYKFSPYKNLLGEEVLTWDAIVQAQGAPEDQPRGNFTSLTTDGSAIYASVLNAQNPLLDSSGIIKIVDTGGGASTGSVSSISDNKFTFNVINYLTSASFNLMASKLCFYNNQLYVGTLNEVSGTEIWRKNQNNNTWTKINTAGFGDNFNYNTLDMKVIDNCLVVSVQNPNGGQVWCYDGSSWEQQDITNPITYHGYLIESFNGNNYLVGQQRSFFTSEKTTKNWLSYQQRWALSAHAMADGYVTCHPIGNGKYRFNCANAFVPVIFEGELDDPVQKFLSPIIPSSTSYRGSGAGSNTFPLFPAGVAGTRGETWDTMECKPDLFHGQLSSLLKYPYPNQLGYVTYSGTSYIGGSIYHKDPETGIIIYLFYTEEGYWGPNLTSLNSWAQGARQFVSFDDGKTIKDCGWAITNLIVPNPNIPSLSSVGNGVGPNGLVKKGDYLYFYYSGEKDSPLDTTFNRLNVARISYKDLIDKAKNREVGDWKKYYNGSFSEPGLNGSSTDIASTNYYAPEIYTLGLVYHDEQKDFYFSFIESPIYVLDSNLIILKFTQTPLLSASKNGADYSIPLPIHIRRTASQYFSLNFADCYPGTCRAGNKFCSYYLHFDAPDNSGGWANIPTAANNYLFRGTYLNETSISETTPESSLYSKGRYLPKYDINYSIDRDQLPSIYYTMHDILEQRKILEASANYPVPATSSAAYRTYLKTIKWKDIYKSYANSATEVSGWSPNDVSDYYNFKFGNNLHKLYSIYTKEFDRHRLSEDLYEFDGPNIFSHTYGPLLYNGDFNLITSSTYITNSLSSFDNRIDKTNLFNSYDTGVGVFSSLAIFNAGIDLINSSIIPGVDIISTSSSPFSNYYQIIKIPKSESKKYSSDYMFDRTFLKMANEGQNYIQRIRFDISRPTMNSSLGYPIQNNFLLPDHNYKVSLNGLILNEDGTESGGNIGVWIHTGLEQNKYWSYDRNGNWIQHDKDIGINNIRGSIIHTVSVPEVNRQFMTPNSSGLDFKCLDTVEGNPIAPIFGLGKNDFYNLELNFDTFNSECLNSSNKGIIMPKVYQDSYGQVHRKNQKYYIEIFSFAPFDRYLLLDKIEVVNSTMNKLATTIGVENKCPDLNIKITKPQLHSIFEFWNDISGKNHKFGYASRNSTETSGVMLAQGGSRLDYRLNSAWCVNAYQAGSKILTEVEVPI